jgi:hypothetical protein
MGLLLLLLPAVLLLLWMISLWLLCGWRYFWRYFAGNLVLLAAYTFLTTQVSLFGHDEYGLGRIFATVGAVTVHTVLGLGFALAVRWPRRQA